ncbi:uncharacterized protein IL334_007880 [Kwoniella shivajii]|uniref:DUF4604 domain-containing protein n=1 Tax=Kwoniella shivajii TaxID=564305 RepID=A0ABZ1DD07_9TREE|nr:hypothetical protein IL334_007880 [Kwoniella shivajii]
MSKKERGPSKQQLSNLSYVAVKPKFLQNFGKPPSPPPPSSASSSSRFQVDPRNDGREAIPSRPKEGRWAGGSDDEGDNDPRLKNGGKGGGEGGEEESDDEWGETFGGGGEEGPQIVVLKQGRHLSKDEVNKLRRKARGEPSLSPQPETDSQSTSKSNVNSTSSQSKSKSAIIPKSNSNTNKRKLVGSTVEDGQKEDGKRDGEKKKKKKAKKGMLSFDEAEGEE